VRGKDLVPVDLSKTAQFGVRSERPAIRATFDCQRDGWRDDRQEEERVSIVRRRVAERTSESLRTASAESPVYSTSVTDVTDALQLTVIVTSIRPDSTKSDSVERRL